jgi:serine/threonine protein kinase
MSASRQCTSSIVEDLRLAICQAVDSTVEGITVASVRDARCFFAKADQDRILDSDSMKQLFKELIAKHSTSLASLFVQPPSTDRNVNGQPEDLINSCVKAMHTPSRVALLSLCLYQNPEALLHIFLRWILHAATQTRSDNPANTGIPIPSDKSMPFTKSSLQAYGVAESLCREILRNQSVFQPASIRRNQDRKLSTAVRLPFLGAGGEPKTGSSGSVSEIIIAKRHWEIQSGNEILIGNPRANQVVALKTFEKTTERDMATTTQEFEIERQILKELGNKKTKHDMIMLDWGSITINDEMGSPLSHHLIFELATFSLQNFLENFRRSDTYKEQSLLLARFVDLVEALAVLHDSLKTLHLNIKPDNILVFEEGSSHSDNQNEDPNKLVFKISDFGLARKKGMRQRTGHNQIGLISQPSHSSATSATRPSGAYQGPEIQQRDTSRAGRGSDVWSIGCVALMMLAFVTGGPAEVSKLTNCLPVDFLDRGGCQKLFYIRSDSYPWAFNDMDHCQYRYLEDFKPDIGEIPQLYPRLQAAVNPKVIVWSNILYSEYTGYAEQKFIKRWLKVIFCSALLIDRTKRWKAAKLHEELREIQEDWHGYETGATNPQYSSFDTVRSPEIVIPQWRDLTSISRAHVSDETSWAPYTLHNQQPLEAGLGISFSKPASLLPSSAPYRS